MAELCELLRQLSSAVCGPAEVSLRELQTGVVEAPEECWDGEDG